jgi:hypothetical protein
MTFVPLGKANLRKKEEKKIKSKNLKERLITILIFEIV